MYVTDSIRTQQIILTVILSVILTTIIGVYIYLYIYYGVSRARGLADQTPTDRSLATATSQASVPLTETEIESAIFRELNTTVAEVSEVEADLIMQTLNSNEHTVDEATANSLLRDLALSPNQVSEQ